MKTVDINMTACGERLKKEAKQRHLSNQDVADIIGYSSGKQISPIYSGKQMIADDQAKLLSQAWNLRKEYLLCKDDWKTEEQMLESIRSNNLYEYNSLLTYLSTIGLEIKPMVYWVCTPRVLYWEYWKLEEYITDNAKEYIQKIIKIPLKYDDPMFDFEEFEDSCHCYSDEPEDIQYIELKSNPIETDITPISELTKQDNISSVNDVDRYTNWSDDYDGFIDILYKIRWHGNDIGIADITNMCTFFNHIDSLCSASIQSLLANGSLCSYTIEEQNNYLKANNTNTGSNPDIETQPQSRNS